jgi:hypothetical protein
MKRNIYIPTDQPTSSEYESGMRHDRNRLLAESDWTQMPDSPLTDDQRAAWATYRQALRDAPANWVPAETWDAPDPPEAPA